MAQVSKEESASDWSFVSTIGILLGIGSIWCALLNPDKFQGIWFFLGGISLILLCLYWKIRIIKQYAQAREIEFWQAFWYFILH